MSQRQLSKSAFPAAGDFQQDLAAIPVTLEFSDKATGCETIGQFHSTVMSKMESFSEIADRRGDTLRQSLESQQ
jgi:hypothetical protein